jgi:hypothetical protein
VWYETTRRLYTLCDRLGLRGSEPFDFNFNVDGTILVVSAVDGLTPFARDRVQIACALGVGTIIPFINKVDLVDTAHVREVAYEVKSCLRACDYRGAEMPVIYGSAVKALQGDADATRSVTALTSAMDRYFTASGASAPVAQRCDTPDVWAADGVFLVAGLGFSPPPSTPDEGGLLQRHGDDDAAVALPQSPIHAFPVVLAVEALTAAMVTDFVDAGCDDAVFTVEQGVARASFERRAPSFEDAVMGAIVQLMSVETAVQVARVEPDDLVTASGIAERTGRTRQSVALLATGQRGRGGFPTPVSTADGKTRIWRWTDVLEWERRDAETPAADLARAHFVAAVNGALTVVRHLARYREHGGGTRIAAAVRTLAIGAQPEVRDLDDRLGYRAPPDAGYANVTLRIEALPWLTYGFVIVLTGDAMTASVVTDFINAGCDDVEFTVEQGVARASFERRAPSFEDAVVGAIVQLMSVETAVQVARVEPDDLVTASGIAERTGRTRQSVALLATGQRGRGGFPTPVSTADGKTRIWRWTDVLEWERRDAETPAADLARAHFVAAVNGALDVVGHLTRYRTHGGEPQFVDAVRATASSASDGAEATAGEALAHVRSQPLASRSDGSPSPAKATCYAVVYPTLGVSRVQSHVLPLTAWVMDDLTRALKAARPDILPWLEDAAAAYGRGISAGRNGRYESVDAWDQVVLVNAMKILRFGTVRNLEAVPENVPLQMYRDPGACAWSTSTVSRRQFGFLDLDGTADGAWDRASRKCVERNDQSSAVAKLRRSNDFEWRMLVSSWVFAYSVKHLAQQHLPDAMPTIDDAVERIERDLGRLCRHIDPGV